MIKFIVDARRWFDRVNGNTYFSCAVTDAETGDILALTKFEYGYDEHYRTWAYDALIKLGLVKAEDRNNHELNRARFHYTVLDVQRKKDL